MKKGTVKFFNHTKGFGFINEEGGSQDYFVHSSGLSDRIQDGDVVEFELAEDPKGMRAVNVKLAE
jgi:CspA family cold shock protein